MSLPLRTQHEAEGITLRPRTAETASTSRAFDVAARRFDVIGDPVRLRILWWLEQGARSVTELCGLLNMRQQAITHHLNIMKLTRLISFRREGRFNRYHLTNAGHEAVAIARSLIR